MGLFNVRLSPEDARIAAELRRGGIRLSQVVRDALRAAHVAHRRTRGRPPSPSVIVATIYADLPDPPGLARRQVDLRGRRSVRRAIAARARRRRS